MQGGGLGRVGAGERVGAFGQAEAGEELGLGDRAVDYRGGAWGLEGFEIDVGGEVCLARVGKRVNAGTGADGLERIAEARTRVAVIDHERGAAVALAKEFNLLCEGAAFVAWDEAEKVAAAEREIYQPIQEIDCLGLASFVHAAGPISPPRLMRSRAEDTTFEIGEPDDWRVYAPGSRVMDPPDRAPKRLGDAVHFFAGHQPSWLPSESGDTSIPLVAVTAGLDLSAWIENLLLKRWSQPELASLLLDWIRGEFGLKAEDDVVQDQAFVQWVLKAGDPALDDPAIARLTRELLEARPPTDPNELQKLRRLLDAWSVDLAKTGATPNSP